MLILDHLAVASNTLAEGAAYVEDALGVHMALGGKHTRFGTHNQLLGMGDIYLEVIAPDPDAAPFEGPRWFDLDRFSGPPRLTNWICRADSFATVAGRPVAMARGGLHWQITVPKDGSMPHGGAYPTLIQWGPGVMLPASTLPDCGCRLTSLTVSTPQMDALRPQIAVDDPRIAFTKDPLTLSAVIDTPRGPRAL